MNRKVLFGSAIALTLASAGVFFNVDRTASYEARVEKQEFAPRAKDWEDDMKRNAKTGLVDEAALAHGRVQMKERAAKRGVADMSFQFLGPNNIGGRTRAIMVDFNNNQRIYAGGTSGGLFISDNGGNEWTTQWDFEDNLYIGSIGQTGNGDVFVGTGHSFDDGNGTGIYKSSDDGQTWSVLESTQSSDFSACNWMIAHPNDDRTLFVCTNAGVMLTEDGGSTWTKVVYDPSGTVPITGMRNAAWSGDEKVLYVASGSGVYYSSTPTDPFSFTKANGVPGAQRIQVGTTDANPNVAYVATASGSNTFGTVFKTANKGEDWNPIDPAPPRSNPGFRELGGQFFHNFLFGVRQDVEDVFFVGGVDIWRFDGNWTLAALRGQGSPIRMHVDHHTLVWDPTDPLIGYFTNDGGVFKTLDGGYSFFEMAKGFQTTQFYGMAFNREGNVVGGTQDQGNIIIDPGVFGTPDYGNRNTNQGVLNGDGFDAAASQIVDAKFTTAQNTSIGRSRFADEQGGGIVFHEFDPLGGKIGGVSGKFWTVTELWESLNDTYSRDSVEFIVDTADQVMGIGNGSQKTFTGFIEPSQASAVPVYTSLSVSSGVSVANDFDGDGALDGDGIGTVDPQTGRVQVTFNVAPQTNAQVKLNYTSTYPAGGVLNLLSKTENLPIRHVLKSSLSPGDRLMVQDPVQSVLAVTSATDQDGVGAPANGAGLLVTRNALRFNEEVEWTLLELGGQPNAIEFSPDGRHMYYSIGGNVRRLTGLEKIYPPMTKAEISDAISISTIYTGSGSVGGLALNPNDPTQLAVFVGGVGHSAHVVVVSNASTNPSSVNVNGDFPSDVPAFDGDWDINSPGRLVVGTQFGVLATDNFTEPMPEWTVVGSTDFTFAEVRYVRQQHMRGAANEGVFYFGSYGRGMWKSESLVSVEERTQFDDWNESELEMLSIYPNPAVSDAKVQLITDGVEKAQLSVFNIKGDRVLNRTLNSLQDGENEIEFNVGSLDAGSYILTIEYGTSKKVGKFIKFE